MKKFRLLTIGAILAIIVVVGCSKETIILNDNSTTASRDNSTGENLFGDIQRVTEEAAEDEGQTSRAGYSFGTCASVSISPAWSSPTWPKIMEIDFGTTNCTGVYGVNRRGKLIVTLTDRYKNAGSVLTIQPQGYYVNDIKIEGTKTITNNGLNVNNNMTFSVDVVNGKITHVDNTIVTWASNRTNEWIEGDTSSLFTHGFPGVCDDVYSITGSSSGVDRQGIAFTVVITNALRKEVCCRWLVSGVVEITPLNLTPRILDFGTGTCDNKATVTLNNNSYVIPMI